jgi:polyphosphate kinase
MQPHDNKLAYTKDTDFLHDHSNEVLLETPDFDLDSPKRFFNRELSWLAFNERVLEESENTRHPLLERVRFLSICGNNLDEFYTVRVAGLLEMQREGVDKRSNDGLTPAQQLVEIEERARRLMIMQQVHWTSLKQELRDNDIHLLKQSSLDDVDKVWLENYFTNEIFPVLTPLAIDPAHLFPFIPNKGLAIIMKLEAEKKPDIIEALITIPPQLARFIRLPDVERGDNSTPEIRFIAIEDVIVLFLPLLFPGYILKESGIFRLLRDSDIEIEEKAEDLVLEFETALKRRRRGQVIRLKVSSEMSDDLRDLIISNLHVTDNDLIPVDGIVGVGDLSQLVFNERPELVWPPYLPRMPERLRDHNGDIFATIRQKDVLLHHPFEAFEVVVMFVQQAALDPDVIAIKQTLYRTSHQSPIVSALCEAAESGKSVTALVELKARFDEAANIRLARQLERAGVQVVFGFMDWKTHAKISTVVRRENGKLVTYSHFGTGNYHPVTAKLYTDLSLFTCDPVLGHDAARVFNFITGYAEPIRMDRMSVAPLDLKEDILEFLAQEVEHARAGRPAQVWAKMNAITDTEVIDALYAASQAGVKIDLVVRGICCLRPGIVGLSENIRVKSIVGRFLEHARIVCFGNGAGLPSPEARVFISSADWMERNLRRRVEIMTEIVNDTVKAQILEQVMAANLSDQGQSWILEPSGRYKRRDMGDEDVFNLHDFFMQYPSLSGRGRRGTEDAPRIVPDASNHEV